MSEKENQELDNAEVQTPVESTPEEEAWFAGMEAKYPDLKGNKEALYKASREGYDKEHELNKQNAEDYGKIYNAIQRSPEAAAFISHLTNPDEGEEPEEAFAEFGEDLVDLLTGKVDAPAYRKKKAELAEKKAKSDALDIEAGKSFVSACEELGLQPEEAEKSLMEKYGAGDDGDFRASKDFYVALLKSLTYDDDMQAAELRGRNAQIGEKNNRRSQVSDGLPHGQAAGSANASAKRDDFREQMLRKAAMNR